MLQRLLRVRWGNANHQTEVGASNPFLKSIPNALAEGRCGICHENAFRKFMECRSLDSGFAPLYVCQNCDGIYNATAEFNEMDVVEWQKKWAEDPDFYKVPTGDEFVSLINEARRTFDFLELDIGHPLKGTYIEIGAGSGIMAASALSRFDDVYVLDHVDDRLLKVREIIGERYHVSNFDQILGIEADVVLIWHAMEHFLDPGGVFGLAASVLKKSGYIFIQVPVLSEEHVYPGHYYFYSEPVFLKLADKYGLTIHKFYYDHAINAMTVAFRKSS